MRSPRFSLLLSLVHKRFYTVNHNACSTSRCVKLAVDIFPRGGTNRGTNSESPAWVCSYIHGKKLNSSPLNVGKNRIEPCCAAHIVQYMSKTLHNIGTCTQFRLSIIVQCLHNIVQHCFIAGSKYLAVYELIPMIDPNRLYQV